MRLQMQLYLTVMVSPVFILASPIANKTPLLFSLGNMYFYKALWNKAVTSSNINAPTQYNLSTHAKIAITYMAGGLGSATGLYFLLSLITAYCSYCDEKNTYDVTIKNLYNGLSPFSHIVHTKNISLAQKRLLLNIALILSIWITKQLFYGFTPYRTEDYADGTILWKKYLGITGIPLKILAFVSNIGFLAGVVWIFKKYCDAKAKLHTCPT